MAKDVDDISLEDTRPPKKSSGGSLAAILIVIILIVVIVGAVVIYGKKQQRKAEETARRNVATQNQATLKQVNANVSQAMNQAQEGNVTAALAKLDAAQNQLTLIISSASQVQDQTTATQALAKKQAILDASKAIGEAQTTFQATVKTQMDALGTKLNVSASPAVTSGAEGAAATPETANSASPAAPPAGTANSPSPASTPNETAPAGGH